MLMVETSFGSRLNNLFEYSGKSKEQLNDYLIANLKTGLGTTVYIESYVLDEKEPSIAEVKLMCSFFNVSADYLLGMGADGLKDDSAVELKMILDILGEWGDPSDK